MSWFLKMCSQQTLECEVEHMTDLNLVSLIFENYYVLWATPWMWSWRIWILWVWLIEIKFFPSSPFDWMWISKYKQSVNWMVQLTPLPIFQDHRCRCRAHTARNCADGAKASRMHLCRFITGSGKALSSTTVSHGSWHGMDVRWKNPSASLRKYCEAGAYEGP